VKRKHNERYENQWNAKQIQKKKNPDQTEIPDKIYSKSPAPGGGHHPAVFRYWPLANLLSTEHLSIQQLQ
jgi:hypothetical protein